jgi:integrase
VASVKKRTTANGENRYDVRLRTPDGKVRTRTFRTRRQADSYATGIEADKLEGRFVDPRSGRQTVGEWWAEWWPTVLDLRDSSRARDESYWRNHVEPRFGDVALNRVQHQDVAEWVAELRRKGLAPATVVKGHQVLNKTLRAAVRAGRLAVNPAIDVTLPRIERDEMRFLTPAEVSVLAATINPRFRAWVVVAAYGGLRYGELAALRWRNVDLVQRRLDVAETMADVRGKVSFGPPKTRASRRAVPFPKVAANALEEHLATYGGDQGDLVFTGPGGGPLRASLFRPRYFDPATVAAGLSPAPEGSDAYDENDDRAKLRPHDLRHTAVAFWIAAKASPKEVAARAGHASIVTVFDRYGHLLPGHEDAVNDALDAMADEADQGATVLRFSAS